MRRSRFRQRYFTMAKVSPSLAMENFTVTFDRVMSAYWGIAVQGGAGAQIYLQTAQSVNAYASLGADNQWLVEPCDGIQYFESPDLAGVGAIYVIVNNVTSPMQILDVSATSASQPVSYAGSFSCSDANLSTIWTDTRWQAQLNLQTRHLGVTVNATSISAGGTAPGVSQVQRNPANPAPWSDGQWHLYLGRGNGAWCEPGTT